MMRRNKPIVRRVNVFEEEEEIQEENKKAMSPKRSKGKHRKPLRKTESPAAGRRWAGHEGLNPNLPEEINERYFYDPGKIFSYTEYLLLKDDPKFNKPKEIPECSICFDPISDKNERRKLNCKHKFHIACINEWLKRNNLCPNCRSEVH